MSLDPPPTTATTTTTSRPTAPFTNPNPNPNSKPIHYPQQQQQPQQQALHVRSPNPFLYPFASPSRASANHAVGGYPPPPPPSQPQPPLLYSHGGGVRGMNLDYLSHALHVTRPLSHVQFPHLAATASPPVKGHLKGTARSTVSDVNGHRDSTVRERSRDDALTVVRDRKVRITEDASLYALCRSWLRNGVNDESQPPQRDVTMSLPKPSPASMVDTCTSNKKDDENDDEQEEDEKSVEHLSTQDLLKRHIKRAKRVRARLREERSQRIARYRSRLRLLVPPPA
ncbi:putative protein LIN37 [Medicago truncatula]|uniref:Uncharacterized protein n=1 Tax=Medicago truncatula TaxID=3880 RepID=G7IJ20_MEDTR|nr:uncharacterized protein LOC11443716 isoform X1 [Medicago truncatula]AES66046.1 hypothetical protein MTR_2g060910 [Medicago truncatula]RHN74278.1 putative protein LIN37 [Medicago truncatula]